MAKSNCVASSPPETDQNFVSLTLALEGHFDTKEQDLPDTLRIRVEEEYYPVPWDMYPAEQRRRIALELDYQKDPATESARQLMWCLVSRQDEIQTKITQCESAAMPTATDFESKESMLKELQKEYALVELEIMELQRRLAWVKYYPEPHKSNADSRSTTPADYIAYPKAMKILREKWKAAPNELAVWLFLGPPKGGITAYLNADKISPPPPIDYTHFIGCKDYSSCLISCWFFLNDIEQFEPTDRYITGTRLRDRWKKCPDFQPQAFINAKIAESRLIDYGPTFGGTKSTFNEQENPPSLDNRLFAMSQIKQIEAEELEDVASSKSTEPKKGGRAPEMLREALEKAYLYFLGKGDVTILKKGNVRAFLKEFKSLIDDVKEFKIHIDDDVRLHDSEERDIRAHLAERIEAVKIPNVGKCSVITHAWTEGKNTVNSVTYNTQAISTKLNVLRKKYPLSR